MYQKVDSSLNFFEREKQVLDFWQKQEIFEKSVELRRDGPRFTFYDGPPTANGKPHIGHILTRVVKDIIPRHRYMKGYNVMRKAGWDTHGLPVELEVEKLLGIDGKEQIEAYGVEEFIQQCKRSVWKYQSEWEEMSYRVGFWMDMEHPYITYENDYIESVWWALRQIWDKGLIYQGHKVVPYCPRCGTALSSHEVAQGYQDVQETSVYVRFPVEGEPNTYFAAWTTTPWTLPSNLALCVNPKESYVLAEVDITADGVTKTDRYYLAEALVETVLGKEARIVERFVGRDLEYKVYRPLFPYANQMIAASGRKAYFVTCDSYVTLTDGTGIVHIAPAFGEDDARIGQTYDLPFVQFVQADGTMPAEVSDFAGQFCKDADRGIIDKLRRDGLLMKEVDFEHNYPFCWRCDTALIYYARHSWFIRMTAVREQLLKNNSHVNWIPETIGTGRFGNFLENVVDWSVSRERYWGTPLPIWQCECGHQHMIGSIEELKKMSPDCPDEIELHKPYIDYVHLTCEKCGGKMTRVPEVIDCWFDSGSMPFAQHHYPFEHRDLFEESFPADFISEAVDQTRGWFYTLMAIGTLLFDRETFKNCIVMGHVLDKDGHKMSKHKGNVVDPWSVLDTEGADAIRWYFYTNSQPWLPSRFSAEAVNESKRKFMGTLWNTYAFYILYAEIDQFDPTRHQFNQANLNVMDRWILSRLNSVIKSVDNRLERYDITGAARALQDFTDDLSNWYVRRGRERYWAAGMEEDKVHAYLTLYTVLETMAKLAAPFTPFLAEKMYQNLVRSFQEDAPESVHLCDFPTWDEQRIDAELEAQMSLVLELVTLGRAARNTSGLKTRQPLARISVVSETKLDDAYISLVLEELNVKELAWIEDESVLQDYQFKPQLRLLGRRFGKNLPELSQKLAELDGRSAYRELAEQGYICVEVAGSVEKLSEEELLIAVVQSEDLATAQDQGIVVGLDTRLNEQLIEEGFVREIVSKVQTMRKESGFEVSDRIRLYHADNEQLAEIIRKHTEFIKADVLAVSIEAMTDPCEHVKQWDINGEKLTLGMVVDNS